MTHNKEKLVLVLGGGDWYDASVDTIVILKGLSREGYNLWKRIFRTLPYKLRKQYYDDFHSFLVGIGLARNPTEKEIEWWNNSL